MPANREILEGEAYWGRIRSIKRKLFALEAILIIVMSVVLVATSEEASLDPFLLPFDKLLGFLAIMSLILMAEGFIFRFMQLHICKSDSTKYIMATNSIRRELITIIVAAIIAIVLLYPGMVTEVERSIAYHGTATFQEPGLFQSKDPLALSTVTSVSIHCVKPAYVYVLSEFLYNQYKDMGDNELRAHAINSEVLADHDLQVDLEDFGYANYYVLVYGLNASGDATASAEFTLHPALSYSVRIMLPIACIIAVAMNAVFVEYLIPQRKKCRRKSIYK